MADPGSYPEWRFRLTPFVFGIIFVAIGLAGVGSNIDTDVSWVWVALLFGAGIAGLTRAIGSIKSS